MEKLVSYFVKYPFWSNVFIALIFNYADVAQMIIGAVAMAISSDDQFHKDGGNIAW